MASHFRLGKCQIMASQSVSSTTTYLSSPLHVLNLDNIAIQLNIAGTPNGTFTIQVSSDYVQDSNGNVLDAGHWIDTPVSVAAQGAADQVFIDITQISAPWMRVKYVNSSSTGTMNVFASGKGLM